MAVPLCTRLNGHGVPAWCFCVLLAFIVVIFYCGIVVSLVVHIVPVIAACVARYFVLPVLHAPSRVRVDFPTQCSWVSVPVGNVPSVGGFLPSAPMFLVPSSLGCSLAFADALYGHVTPSGRCSASFLWRSTA